MHKSTDNSMLLENLEGGISTLKPLKVLKPYSQKSININRNFETVRIGRFWQFQRYQTRKICGIVCVVIKKL